MQKIQRILVPIDFSSCSRAALDQALTIAERFGAVVDVVHAWDLPAALRPDLTVWAGDISGTLAEHARGDAERAMSAFLEEAGLAGREDVTSRVVGGAPYETIVAALEEGSYQLVVMGTHGRTGLSHVLLGSVAERVVRHSAVPVLTVRRAEGT
jgi:nucleotide-binding universal stress UspA family protein